MALPVLAMFLVFAAIFGGIVVKIICNRTIRELESRISELTRNLCEATDCAESARETLSTCEKRLEEIRPAAQDWEFIASLFFREFLERGGPCGMYTTSRLAVSVLGILTSNERMIRVCVTRDSSVNSVMAQIMSEFGKRLGTVETTTFDAACQCWRSRKSEGKRSFLFVEIDISAWNPNGTSVGDLVEVLLRGGASGPFKFAIYCHPSCQIVPPAGLPVR